ncbi:MAG: ABC transporter permease [Gemmatimonadales bacterium]|nr:ABC transporter permease [Gemmatimonadales bacterium]
MRGSALWQLTLCRFREFYRMPEALFWAFVFPILLAVVLGIAFRNRGPQKVRVGVEIGDGADSLVAALRTSADVTPVLLPGAQAERELRAGRVVLLVVAGNPVTYRYDAKRTESRIARLATDDALQRAFGRRDARAVTDRRVTETGSRYIDFLIPGLIGMNLMGAGLWGVGFAVVQNRTRKLLKRLVASPMRRWHYLASYLVVRFALVPVESGAIAAFGAWAFGVPVRGSMAALLGVALLGSFCFSSLGLLVASRAQTVEAVAGLMNVVMLPMWFLSGVFFSAANFPDVMQPFIKVLPLTALADALRAIMIDGASIVSQGGELAIVALWGAVSFGVAVRIFRWL